MVFILCAWCGRRKTDDGWVETPHPINRVTVSDGLCGDCEAKINAEMDEQERIEKVRRAKFVEIAKSTTRIRSNTQGDAR